MGGRYADFERQFSGVSRCLQFVARGDGAEWPNKKMESLAGSISRSGRTRCRPLKVHGRSDEALARFNALSYPSEGAGRLPQSYDQPAVTHENHHQHPREPDPGGLPPHRQPGSHCRDSRRSPGADCVRECPAPNPSRRQRAASESAPQGSGRRDALTSLPNFQVRGPNMQCSATLRHRPRR